MRHVLVSSEDDGLVEELRHRFPPGSVFLSARGVDDTLERLARSSRVDAVLTDDPGVARAIREEVPGSLPVVVVPPGASTGEVIRLLEEELPGE